MTMEYRTWTAIDDLPFADESGWLPFTRHLEQTHPELGPVASWDDETTIVIILADDYPNRAAAAEGAVSVVEESLRATHLSDRLPRVLEVEAVETQATAAA